MYRSLTSSRRICAFAGVCALSASVSAPAATVHVVMRGTVEYNQFNSGTFAGVVAGDPIYMRIKLDSNNFLNNPTQPMRGYWFDYTKFFMTVGSVDASLSSSVTTAYFVIRNNHPAVDGFIISTIVGLGNPPLLDMTPSGYGIGWYWTLADATTLSSLDLLDALGTYGYPNISVYNWAVQFNEISYPMYFNPPETVPSFALCLPGDTNGDEATNLDDIPSFVDALMNSTTDLSVMCAADTNLDGSLDGQDIQLFTECLIGGCP
jgi:hypothetical protein